MLGYFYLGMIKCSVRSFWSYICPTIRQRRNNTNHTHPDFVRSSIGTHVWVFPITPMQRDWGSSVGAYLNVYPYQWHFRNLPLYYFSLSIYKTDKIMTTVSFIYSNSADEIESNLSKICHFSYLWQNIHCFSTFVLGIIQSNTRLVWMIN